MYIHSYHKIWDSSLLCKKIIILYDNNKVHVGIFPFTAYQHMHLIFFLMNFSRIEWVWKFSFVTMSIYRYNLDVHLFLRNKLPSMFFQWVFMILSTWFALRVCLEEWWRHFTGIDSISQKKKHRKGNISACFIFIYLFILGVHRDFSISI